VTRPDSAAPLLLALAAERPRALGWGVWAGAGAILFAVVVLHAWAAEDAFITFRTVQQFVGGDGLRWNIDERVQVYTHPLWMFACIPFFAIFGDTATSASVLGVLCTFGTWLALGLRYARRPAVLLAGAFLPLISSTAFWLYATSGFENSLSFLCFTVYAVLLLRGLDRDQTPWFWLAFVGSLGVVNRLDTVLFYVPPMLFVMLSRWREIRWGCFLAGYWPIFGWLVFSTFYYGFPYPNTALAKLNEEIPRALIVRQGFFYGVDLLRRDPAGFVTLVLGAAVTLTHLVRSCLARTPDRRRALGTASLGLGVLLYGAYVVWIGGSFLSRRHWSVPIVGTAVVLAETLEGWARGAVAAAARGELEARVARRLRQPRVWAGAASAALLAAWALSEGPGIQPGELALTLFPGAKKNERPRKVLEKPAGRMELTRDFGWRTSGGGITFVHKGLRMRKAGIGTTTTIGLTSIAAGRDTIIIDQYALSDPLLARLPPEGFRMAGHFIREVPAGYETYRTTGSMAEMDPDLQSYYEPLRLIISGPLFNGKRLATIWRFNIGEYDRHRDAYVARRKLQKLQDGPGKMKAKPGS
jgi:arabinofuranosyltransferase